MPETKEGLSMYDTLKSHDETIEEHGDKLQLHDRMIKLHDEEIAALKRTGSETTDALKDLKTDFQSLKTEYKNLETAIWKTAQSTQDYMRETTKNQWELIKARDDLKEEESKRKHEKTMSNQEIKKMGWEKFWDISLKLVGGGSILYLVIEGLLGR